MCEYFTTIKAKNEDEAKTLAIAESERGGWDVLEPPRHGIVVENIDDEG